MAKGASRMLLILLFASLICENQSAACGRDEEFKISREEAVLIAKAEAMRLKYVDSIEKITKIKVVIDPTEHDWSKDEQFNGKGQYANSRLKRKKYWEIFFDACCAFGTHGLVFVDATTGEVLEVDGGA